MPTRGRSGLLFCLLACSPSFNLCDALFTSPSAHEPSKRTLVIGDSILGGKRPRAVTFLGSSLAIDGNAAVAPSWVPFEAVERAARRLGVSSREFEDRYADVEAYTSCDDEGDGLHECDVFGDYLHPTKWIHLRDCARAELGRAVAGFTEDEVWLRPHSMIGAADRVAEATMRWCMGLSLQTTNDIRVKVVPSSFGLEGFEDTVRDAAFELLRVTGELSHHDDEGVEVNPNAITFVVCAPEGDNENDLGDYSKESFTEFAADLKEQLLEESEHTVTITPFHPHVYRSKGGPEEDGNIMPYPAAAISLATASVTALLDVCQEQISTVSV